jgi:hypothetical protein
MLFGRWLIVNEGQAYTRGFWLGVVLLAAFLLIRYLDGFGNIRPRAGDTWIDFFNVVKYPPSLAFTTLTTGINLILLAGFSRASKRLVALSQPLAVFGREPLFMYVTHLFLYMLLGRIFAPSGTNLTVMYPYWLAGMALLYPLALWYRRFKQGRLGNPLLHFL